MKDVFSVKRSADGDDVLKHVNGQYAKVKTLSAAAETVEDVESGTVFIVDTSSTGANLVISLPAAGGGLHYRFFFKAAGSQIVHIDAKAVTSGTNDDFLGSISDSEGATQSSVAYNGSSHNQITVGASYEIGDYIEIVGTDANQWLVLPTSTSTDIGEIAAANSSANTSE